MDARRCMIVDLEKKDDKQMFITEQVESIQQSKSGGWLIRFRSSPRIFQYNKARLLYLTQPEVVNLEEKGLYINNIRIANVAEILRFSMRQSNFYRITYTNGFTENLLGKNVYITRTPIDKQGGSTWDYLKKLAEETGLCDEEENNILSKGYNLIDLKRDNVPLSQFLGDKTTLKTHSKPKQVYFPFGCNVSQKAAVEAALTNQVSIIQGPPGTGKTQTILNIIANLLLEDKSILVVSNNNSAVENVAEKLEREGLEFLVAQLGNSENKGEFIRKQIPYYPDMKSWELEEPSVIKRLAKEKLQIVSQMFDDQTELAKLKAEYNALITEKKYNDQFNIRIIKDGDWLKNKPSVKLMELLNVCQLMVEQSKKPSLWLSLKWSFILGFPTLSLLRKDLSGFIAVLENAYYEARKSEIEKDLDAITTRLHYNNLESSIKELTSSSLQLLKQ